MYLGSAAPRAKDRMDPQSLSEGQGQDRPVVSWSEVQLTPGETHCGLTYTCALLGAFSACCSVLPRPQALLRMGFRYKFGFITQFRPEKNRMHSSYATQMDTQVVASSSSGRSLYPVNTVVKPESRLSDFPVRNETSETVAQVSP